VRELFSEALARHGLTPRMEPVYEAEQATLPRKCYELSDPKNKKEQRERLLPHRHGENRMAAQSVFTRLRRAAIASLARRCWRSCSVRATLAPNRWRSWRPMRGRTAPSG